MNAWLAMLIIAVSFFILLAMGLPIAFCLLGVSILFIAVFIGSQSLFAAYASIFRTATKAIYIAIPLFIFMAVTLQYSGIGHRFYDAQYKWFGGLNGGLAIGTVVSCTLVAAMTGLGATGVVTVGSLAYPEMEKRGYHKSISLGCIPPGGALGPLIPPSIVMIILAGFTSVSVGKLFMAGVFPGLLMSSLFCVYIVIRCRLKPELAPALPFGDRATSKEKISSLLGLALPMVLILLVLGTIYLGICTPSEAAGIGAFGALVIAALYRQLSWGNFKQIAFTALQINCMVMWLIMGGTAFASLMSIVGASPAVSSMVAGMGAGPMSVVIMVLLLSLLLGMFMDAGAVIMILIPLCVPILSQMGVDLLWFSLVFTISTVTGYVTPPFGMNLFVTKGVIRSSDVSLGDIYRAAIPFALIMLICLIICIIFPPIALWLPSMMK